MGWGEWYFGEMASVCLGVCGPCVVCSDVEACGKGIGGNERFVGVVIVGVP